MVGMLNGGAPAGSPSLQRLCEYVVQRPNDERGLSRLSSCSAVACSGMETLTVLGGITLKPGDAVWKRSGNKHAHLFVRAIIQDLRPNNECTLAFENGDAPAVCRGDELHPANERGVSAPEHTSLVHLNEPAILDNTAQVSRRSCAADSSLASPEENAART